MRPSVVVLFLSLLFVPAVDRMGYACAAHMDIEAEIVGVRVGVGGRYKAGCWTPVEVSLGGARFLDEGELTLTLPDGDGVPSRFSTRFRPVGPEVDSGRTPVTLYARFGRVKSELAVELRSGGGVVDRRVFTPGATPGYSPAVRSEQELVICVGPGSLGVEQAVALLEQEADRRTVVVRVEDLAELPTRWYGYEAVQTVVLSTSDREMYAGLKPTNPHVAALEEWVRLGGRLVLCAGEHAEAILGHGPEAALARLAPGRVEQMVPLRRAKAYELYCGSSVRVPMSRDGIRVPHFVDVRGKIEAADGPLPLVIRGAHGFGQVALIAADLDQPPFAQWQDRGFLMGKLLGYPARPLDEDEEGTALMHYGYTDLAGQMRSALDQFPSVWVVPFSVVVGLVVLYVLAIGPGDYFLLRKVVGRMHLTWVTFPLIVVAFSVTAYVLAHRFKGDRILLNQVDLVDVDAESGRVRGTAWVNVFSPRTRRYDLAFQPYLFDGRAAGDAATLTGWLGLPGDALGGMNPRTAEPAVWRTCYDFRPGLEDLQDVPIRVWSTKSLTGRWTARTQVPLSGELVEEEGLLSGRITNALRFRLSDCLLAYGIHAYELGTVEAGETIRVGSKVKRRELKSLLTGRQIVFNEEKDDWRPQSTPYDQASVDVAYILRAMMFYGAAGGRSYTGLLNRYQGFVDFSHLLSTDRAVLVGRAEPVPGDDQHHGAKLLCDGRPVPREQVRHTAVYRFVFPVDGVK
jgi:hypothetical protein